MYSIQTYEHQNFFNKWYQSCQNGNPNNLTKQKIREMYKEFKANNVAIETMFKKRINDIFPNENNDDKKQCIAPLEELDRMTPEMIKHIIIQFLKNQKKIKENDIKKSEINGMTLYDSSDYNIQRLAQEISQQNNEFMGTWRLIEDLGMNLEQFNAFLKIFEEEKTKFKDKEIQKNLDETNIKQIQEQYQQIMKQKATLNINNDYYIAAINKYFNRSIIAPKPEELNKFCQIFIEGKFIPSQLAEIKLKENSCYLQLCNNEERPHIIFDFLWRVECEINECLQIEQLIQNNTYFKSMQDKHMKSQIQQAQKIQEQANEIEILKNQLQQQAITMQKQANEIQTLTNQLQQNQPISNELKKQIKTAIRYLQDLHNREIFMSNILQSLTEQDRKNLEKGNIVSFLIYRMSSETDTKQLETARNILKIINDKKEQQQQQQNNTQMLAQQQFNNNEK